ncbi:MAG TPA: hypothetical protein VGC69_17440 [Bordetella sp.]
MATGRWLLLGVWGILLLAGCSSTPPGKDGGTPNGESMSVDQMVQTDFNRTVTMAMRDNLNGLYVLLDKLYRRNPREWRKSGQADEKAAVQRVKTLIEQRQPPAGLAGLRDVQILAVALNPNYSDDRVAAFVYGLADTIIAAHGDKVRFHALDVLDGQRIYNAARNVEAADWLLSTRRAPGGGPLLLSNEMGDGKVNLSFEREFGALIGRLDLEANLLGENIRRIGINYAQSLMFFNFLPVR